MYGGFEYLVKKHTIEGARSIFEELCTQMCHKIYGAKAKSVQVSQGDGGIDVLIGDIPEAEAVYQCKFFYDRIGDSQKTQIKDSFNTVTKKYKMSKWYLCIATILTQQELLWWSSWKKQKEDETGISIELLDGSNIISKLKSFDLYNLAFDEDIRLSLSKIEEYFRSEKNKIFEEIIYGYEDDEEIIGDYQDSIFVKMLLSARIEDIDGPIVEFYNSEIVKKVLISKDQVKGEQVFCNLKNKVRRLWKTQFSIDKHPEDGNLLLAKVAQRIEDFDTTTLKTVPEFSLIAKMGMLHQLADEKNIGWIENYIVKLSEYLG